MKRRIVPKSFKALAVILKLWQALELLVIDLFLGHVRDKTFYEIRCMGQLTTIYLEDVNNKVLLKLAVL